MELKRSRRSGVRLTGDLLFNRTSMELKLVDPILENSTKELLF